MLDLPVYKDQECWRTHLHPPAHMSETSRWILISCSRQAHCSQSLQFGLYVLSNFSCRLGFSNSTVLKSKWHSQLHGDSQLQRVSFWPLLQLRRVSPKLSRWWLPRQALHLTIEPERSRRYCQNKWTEVSPSEDLWWLPMLWKAYSSLQRDRLKANCKDPSFAVALFKWWSFSFLFVITKGSVSYLSLLAKAYCREGHASVPDFGYYVGPPPEARIPPGSPFLGVCVHFVFPKFSLGFPTFSLAIELIRLIVCKCSSCVMLMLSVDCCCDGRCCSSSFFSSSSSSSASSP